MTKKPSGKIQRAVLPYVNERGWVATSTLSRITGIEVDKIGSTLRRIERAGEIEKRLVPNPGRGIVAEWRRRRSRKAKAADLFLFGGRLIR